MGSFQKRALLILLLSTIGACDSSSDSVDSSFVAAQGLILVGNGTVAEIASAIRGYDEMRRNVYPAKFRIELHPQSQGSVAVLLPDGLPAYDLPNLTGWLSAPPEQEDVSDARCWITSPGNGEQYYLEPELDNRWGDTLIGASSAGKSIRVSLPETGLSEVTSVFSYREEPEIELAENPVVLYLTLDTNTGFGNPTFVIDSPIDHDWRW
ncbi:hypothetical protein [Wenzhouxiangella marina]|uniref:hypothetical protein n=1 Tax=Wenzhouxiangella marina TaxID=1579979 RepID=UPI0006733A0E|nr:hypothetical protein [Wenzhouxiangella marina]MBB6086987.1 hypothetical protein [Wenzhouxiangella marina]